MIMKKTNLAFLSLNLLLVTNMYAMEAENSEATFKTEEKVENKEENKKVENKESWYASLSDSAKQACVSFKRLFVTPTLSDAQIQVLNNAVKDAQEALNKLNLSDAKFQNELYNDLKNALVSKTGVAEALKKIEDQSPNAFMRLVNCTLRVMKKSCQYTARGINGVVEFATIGYCKNLLGDQATKMADEQKIETQENDLITLAKLTVNGSKYNLSADAELKKAQAKDNLKDATEECKKLPSTESLRKEIAQDNAKLSGTLAEFAKP